MSHGCGHGGWSGGHGGEQAEKPEEARALVCCGVHVCDLLEEQKVLGGLVVLVVMVNVHSPRWAVSARRALDLCTPSPARMLISTGFCQLLTGVSGTPTGPIALPPYPRCVVSYSSHDDNQ